MMASVRQGEHRPVQTSAVIVLGDSQRQSIPPPSPPTPSVRLSNDGWNDPTDGFSLSQISAKEEQLAKHRRLMSATHVLSTEAAALVNLSKLYEIDAVSRESFNDAVKAITRHTTNKGKLVIIGVGKSGHIAKKLVASMQSLAIRAVFLHPTEALHGDLGIVCPNDLLVFITFSGKTPELLLLLPHLDASIPSIVVTSHLRSETCEIVRRRPNTILLPAPIPEPETVSFGVPAPSSSTTVALALGDALAITAANELHSCVASTFAKNHPGGAIGAAAAASSCGTLNLGQISTPWEHICDAAGLHENSLGLHLLRAGHSSKAGWVKVGEEIASPSKIRNLSDSDLQKRIHEIPNLTVSRQQMLAMSSETTIRRACDIMLDMQLSPVPEQEMMVSCVDSVVAVTNGGRIIGVLEIEQVLNHPEGNRSMEKN